MTPNLAELLAGAINHIDERQVNLMLELSKLKAVVSDLQGSVSNEIAKRVDFSVLQADVDTITDSLSVLHQALTADPSVAGLAAVAQALNTSPVVSDPVVAPATPESPVAPAAAPSTPSALGPVTGVVPDWLKAVRK